MIMKKFLLFAIAALTIGTANAQLLKKQAGKPQTKHQMMQQKATQQGKFVVAGKKAGVVAVDKTSNVFKGSVKAKDIKPVVKQFSAARAGAVQPLYNGFGTLRSTNEAVKWEMASGTNDEGKTLLKDVIPNIFGFQEGVIVEYTAVEGGILIQPQLVASFDHEQAPSGTFYIFLESASSNDGSITLALDDEGRIVGTYDIIYSLYPNPTYNFNEWIQTYNGIKGAQYSLPGEIVKPTASFETGNLVLFAGLGLNGYSYNSNIAITSAYAPTTFANLTSDVVTGWNWAAYDDGETDEDPDVVVATGTEKDFSLPFTDNLVKNVTLTAINETVESDPFTFGIGKAKNDDGSNHYSDCYIYGGGSEGWFMLNSETPAIMTRQDPDGDLTFYTNWATPDKAANNMSKIYCYHEKPAAPLYITGVTLPLVNFSSTEDFNLHIKIQKVTYRAGATRPTLGEVIAEGDATNENVNANFNVGLTAVEFNNLYYMDENEMSTDLDYLFLDDEFVIVIEGWNNGTFTGVLGSQDAPLDNARTSTWFEKDGEPGTMYSYTSWKTSLFVGLLGATYGYLYTEDSKDIKLDAAGGQAAIKVRPFYYNGEEAAAESGQTRLFLDENVADNEIPEWLSVAIADEVYTDEEQSFNLVFSAEALPEGVEGRQADLVFFQEGAQLKVTVTQGTVTGIAATKVEVKSNNSQMFNLAGQRVNKGYKGLVIKNGRKMLNK